MRSSMASILILAVQVAICLCLPACAQPRHYASLKKVFEKDFLMGTAVNARQIANGDQGTRNLLLRHFNVITPENAMKSKFIHPAWDRYDFRMADEAVQFAAKHQLQVVGHTLIWHSQLAPFVTNISKADSMKMYMRNHINTILNRYNESVQHWDVVNEALKEDGSLRETVFYKTMGESYIPLAFELAAAAAPGATLCYNDYNIEQPAKRAGVLKLIQKLQQSGIKIDEVGIQGHWHLGRLPLKDIEESIIAFSKLGLKVAITELDINVLPLPKDFDGADVNQRYEPAPEMNPYPNSLPDSVQQQLARDYENLFSIFLKHRDKISRITFWGIQDGQSWLNNWPIRGRTNYPLLFDRAGKPKPAFFKIIALKHKPS